MDPAAQWEFIDRKAAEMGVGEEARRKWRTRGVAHKYRLPILEAARKERFKLNPSMFDGLRPSEAA